MCSNINPYIHSSAGSPVSKKPKLQQRDSWPRSEHSVMPSKVCIVVGGQEQQIQRQCCKRELSSWSTDKCRLLEYFWTWPVLGCQYSKRLAHPQVLITFTFILYCSIKVLLYILVAKSYVGKYGRECMWFPF